MEKWIKAKGRHVLAASGVKVYLYSLTDFAKGKMTYYYASKGIAVVVVLEVRYHPAVERLYLFCIGIAVTANTQVFVTKLSLREPLT